MTLMLKPMPKFSKDRKPNTILKRSGLHHCNAKWCEWFYDGRSYARAILPYEGKGHVDIDEVNRRIASREAERERERIDELAKAVSRS